MLGLGKGLKISQDWQPVSKVVFDVVFAFVIGYD